MVFIMIGESSHRQIHQGWCQLVSKEFVFINVVFLGNPSQNVSVSHAGKYRLKYQKDTEAASTVHTVCRL